MKKILFIPGGLGQGGAERQSVTVGINLKRLGYDVEFLCFIRDDFYEPLLKKEEIRVVRRDVTGFVKRMFMVRRYVRRGDYDVVISFMNYIGFFNDFAAIGGHRWKVITSERGSARDRVSFSWKVYAKFQRLSDFIVCNSVNSYDFWASSFPKYKEKLKVIYNSVTVDIPKDAEYDVKKEDRLHIVIAARMDHVKNPICLLEALNQMTPEERKLMVIDWYGANGNATDEVVAKVKKYGLGSCFKIHAATDTIIRVMNEADAVALFSKHEGLPNAICEAMKIGKPIIMTKVSDYSALVDEKNGELCEIEDPLSIKCALLKMAQREKKEMLKMGEQSKEKAFKMFSQEIVTNKWIEIIEK